jgi:hypothetical protein
MQPILPIAFCFALFGYTIAMPLNRSHVINSVPVEHAQMDTQGIQGVVQQLTGNHMPSVGHRMTQGAIAPVQTTVWIFAGRIPSHGSPNWSISAARQHPALVQQVKTDVQGRFSVSLPVGEYTLFAQYDSDLYLNGFLADGSYDTVQVERDRITDIRLDHTELAAF